MEGVIVSTICLVPFAMIIGCVHFIRSRDIKQFWENGDYYGGLTYCGEIGLQDDFEKFTHMYVTQMADEILHDMRKREEHAKRHNELYFNLNESDMWT